jgi:hypothetical protein
MFWNKGRSQWLNSQPGPATSSMKASALGQAYFDNLTWEELFNNFCPAIVAYNDSLAADARRF